MILDRAFLRDFHEFLRRELQHEGHDAEIRVQCAHRVHTFLVAQGRELEDLEPFFLGRRLQGIGLCASLLGSAEHAGDFVAARKKCLQHGFAEVLLPDDRYLHRYAFFGGTEKAPARLRPAILVSS